MKKSYLAILSLTCCVLLSAQQKLFIHKADKTTLGAPISKIDSLNFSDDASTLFVRMEATVAEYPVASLDSISFGENSNTITIQYSGNSVSVINPLAFEGVGVTVNGADVVVHSTMENISYALSGTTGNGSFKIYSEKSFQLQMNGVAITNPDGPAINSQSKKTARVLLADGTNNSLTDGISYVVANNGEDQSGTFFSEGQLLFSGNGSLTINGYGSDQHALCSDDYIQIDNGNITITRSVKDGIHAKDGYIQNNGTVNITSGSDGIDADVSFVNITGGTTNIACANADVAAICCDSTLTIAGGNIGLNVSGLQSKGLKSTKAMTLSGGNVSINASGGVALPVSGAGVDPSYTTGIKCSTDVLVNGANISIIHTGVSGKGISSNTYQQTSGTVSINTSGNGAVYTNNLGAIDAYSAAGISTNGTLNLLGGTVTITSTGTGGKGISADGVLTIGSANAAPNVNVATSGAAILYLTNSITEPKAIKGDADIYLVNGTVNINASGAGEGIDTKSSIYMSGGMVVVQGSSISNTKAVDFETNFNVTGGTFMACGPYRSKSIPTPTTSTSTQNFIYATLSSATTLPANTLFNIQNAAGASVVTFQPFRNSYYFIFSSPDVAKNTSYNLFTGGSSTGSNINGLYIGGAYTPGAKKKTFTSSATTTKTSTTFGL